MQIEDLHKKHHETFGLQKTVSVCSPGRINLIGEHTDYNDGFVFPAAINKEICFVASKNNKGLFRFFSVDYNEFFEMEITHLAKSNTHWANYLLGVAAQFIKTGDHIGGIDCVFGGNIPIGAGLSSSAAIETGFALIVDQLYNCKKSKMQQVKMSQKAEHEYAGVMCGIMDQMAIVFGKANSAIKLDCRSLEFDYANFHLLDYNIVLCDTKVKHSLASSEYNTRRRECEQGVDILKKQQPRISALRDVDLNFLHKHKKEMPKVIYKRCKYVVEENIRVNQAFAALQTGDIKQLGELMHKSHLGLKNDFEVSCIELDILEETARKLDEVIGARMMGGGFGGCTINLVEKEGTETFLRKIQQTYKSKTGIDMDFYIVQIADGTRII